MKIPLNKKRYVKRMIALLFITVLFGFLTSMMTVMTFLKENINLVSGILLLILCGMIAFFAAYTTVFYFSIRKLEYAFTYENGELNDYSKPFNKARGIKREDIKSITQWSDTRGIHQYILVKKNFGLGGNALIHQLKGNHIYFSDYVVDPEELKRLVQLIESEKGFNEKKDELD